MKAEPMLRGRNLILIVTVALCLALGATAAVFVIAFAPNTATYEGARGVKIPREATFEQVVDSLATGGILGSRFTFRLMARATGWGDQIKAVETKKAVFSFRFRMLFNPLIRSYNIGLNFL